MGPPGPAVLVIIQWSARRPHNSSVVCEMNIIYKIKRWYSGYVDIENDMPHSMSLTIHEESKIKPSITSVLFFIIKEYKWIITTVLMALGVIAGFIAAL